MPDETPVKANFLNKAVKVIIVFYCNKFTVNFENQIPNLEGVGCSILNSQLMHLLWDKPFSMELTWLETATSTRVNGHPVVVN